MTTLASMSDDHMRAVVTQANQLIAEDPDFLPRPKARIQAPLDPVVLKPVLDYLLTPYETGYWELRAGWNYGSTHARYLIEQLKILANYDEGDVPPPLGIRRALRKLEPEQRENLSHAASRLSAVFSLFKTCVEGQTKEAPEWRKDLDLTSYAVRWSEALKYFKDFIYFDQFRVLINDETPFKIATGVVVFLEFPRDGNRLVAIGTKREDLEHLLTFFSMLGLLIEPQLHRIFAPDEQLFRPYFPLVSSGLSNIISDEQVSKHFEDALAYYREADFQHCISTLGLIAEDHLQRIYTTLLREQAPNGVTLGQIVAQIHQKLEQLLPGAKASLKSTDGAHSKINEIDGQNLTEQLQAALREIVSLIHDDRIYHKTKLEDATRPPTKRTVFPQGIYANLNELIKWRNAASHNSRIPLAGHEADRTLFCLVTLIAWWQEQLKSLDWRKDRLTLINELIQKSKPVN
ncbi:hypothetical protein ACA040_002215 [Xenophilus aerolatus]